MKRYVLLALFFVPAVSEAKSVVTRADGVAEVGSDPAKARDLAIANALKQAVAQAAGQWIESEFSSRQAELSDKNRNDFVSQVEDKVKVDTQGFVETYKVVSEKSDAGVLRVTLEAVVNTKKLNDMYTALTEALAKRAMKVYVVARERYEPAQPNAPALAPAFIEGELAKAGLIVQTGINEAYTEDTALLAKHGRSKGVDVVVVVDAYYKNLGVIGPGAEFEALVGQTRAEVKLIVRSVLVHGARVLSAQPVSMTTIGINLDRALARALSGTGDNAIKKSIGSFFEQLLAELEKNPTAPVAQAPQPAAAGVVSVVVHKVKSYKQQAKPLTDLIARLKGTASAKEVSFNDDTLELAVQYDGDEATLASAILQATDRKRCCKDVDKKASGHGRVELTF